MEDNLTVQQEKYKPRRKRRTINWKYVTIIFIMSLYIGSSIYSSIKETKPTIGTLSYNEMIEMIEDGKVEYVSVTKTSDIAYLQTVDGFGYDIVNPQSDTFVEDLMKAGADVRVKKYTLGEKIASLFISLPLMLILVMFLLYISNTVISGSTKMFKLLKPGNNNTTFDDIRGITETKTEVKFLVDRVKDWKKIGELGARPVKGVLFYGPPGTGKTLLAKAIAKEANVPFISATGSDFNEMFVGVGAARVRSLWDLATSNAPCILFIDEIDCFGNRRKGGDAASNDSNQTLNCLLQRMDGLDTLPGVLVIAATNRKDSLDPALLRSGRFDRQYYVGPPSSKKDRDDVVNLYLNSKKLADDVTLEKASKLLVGLSAADIDEVLSDAVYMSLQDGRDGVIKLNDIDEAVMKVRVGGVKKEHTSLRDEEVTAIHEAGHTLASLLFNIDIAKVSITPYSSGTGGVTVADLDKTGDIKLKMKSDYEKEIQVLLAGKVAEEIKYGEHTQGCSADLETASKIVYGMITSFGMGDTILNENTLIENGVSHLIEKEIIDDCNKRLNEYNDKVKKLLEENKELLYKLADKLLEEKTIVQPTLEYIKELN